MNIFTKIARRVLSLAKKILIFLSFFWIAEKFILSKKVHVIKPQLFIFGLPRTGTTLIYQYIVHRLEVAYFTNGVGKHPEAPCFVTFLQSKIYGDYKSDFKSHYGKVEGPVAPREAGAFWGRFFGTENYIRYDDANPEDIKCMRNTVAHIQQIFKDRPFVNKNVKHILRIDAINKIFPNAYFLIVEREMKDVALSLMRGRYETMDDPKKWLSVKPLNYENLKGLSIPEQIAGQLYSLKQKMESDISEILPGKVLRIKYEQFCKDPEDLIRQIEEIFPFIKYRNTKKDFFKQTTNIPKSPEEERLITLIEDYEKTE